MVNVLLGIIEPAGGRVSGFEVSGLKKSNTKFDILHFIYICLNQFFIMCTL